MSKTNIELLSMNLSQLGEWFRKNDIRSALDMTCIYCGGIAQHSDHVIPRSRGGSDDANNIVPACITCNVNKSTLTPFEWLGIDNSSVFYGSERHLKLTRASHPELEK